MAEPTSSTDPNTIARVTVVADDGVPLAATVTGPRDADLTLVCLHGHCQDATSWDAVCGSVDLPGLRIVRYDQRGHGRSGTGDATACTVSGMSDDLDAVLRTLAPDGPVVLAGYSMGGMVALSYARRRPDAVGDRIVGVGLIATAASGLADGGIGRYLRHPAASIVHRAVSRAPRVMELSKRAGGRVCIVAARRRTEESWLRVVGSALSNETSVVTWSRLLADFAVLDESAALDVLARVPVVVAAGTEDVFVPLSLSEAMAARLPHANLVRFAGAGHRVLADRPEEVARALSDLLRQVRTQGSTALAQCESTRVAS
ncbi:MULTISPECIES: alpha/beta fold hydrolase [Rhodococcus]|jgi:pimeloyl-ACP methyl ester carboxylesterase|uniref:Alpha/beta hydrolase n=1 Tax=Rhodococcus rhodochrous TaxID=1829 RepID=A0A385LIC9_RHORH|nr:MULTISPECIES: alpha/beta hydrolase [Rhodococcus]AYA27670.1 alpha/beta hydrolase [Rhodococcus rhodochrous]MBF4478359.1 alpha/beta hydrolase [Rhodococcus rhodochrous]MCB8910527.1 alpha/beta hydrolase [Rhodococcus rhodochrous]MCD2097578.1 alpha/beta hydrolase [Rhodococcus rhodochrous]MCD2122800.1 alpha/beta hydrolase [Rhodococcus rhodochrous]